MSIQYTIAPPRSVKREDITAKTWAHFPRYRPQMSEKSTVSESDKPEKNKICKYMYSFVYG